MIDENREELATLHALDLLEGAELDRFTAELARDPDLRNLVSDLRLAATTLAHAAPDAEPPAELRARVLASAASIGVDAPLASATPKSGGLISFPTLIPWLVAASIAVAAYWSNERYHEAEARSASLSEQKIIAESALRATRAQLDDAKRLLAQSGREIAELSANLKAEGDLAHLKIATLASMLGNSPAALAVAVWDPTREEGVLTVSKLPALASEKDYQLWVIDKQYPTPVSGGVFVVDPTTGEAHIVFKADKPVHSIAKFAVSLERKGGVPAPEGPIVLLSD
jgi:anti-sigma-K factor RskA